MKTQNYSPIVDKIKSLCEKHGLAISTDEENNIVLSDGFIANNITDIFDHLVNLSAVPVQPISALDKAKQLYPNCTFSLNHNHQIIVTNLDGSLAAVYDQPITQPILN